MTVSAMLALGLAFLSFLLGLLAEHLVTSVLFPSVGRRWRKHKERRAYARNNEAWSRVSESISPRLQLAQQGWSSDGYFAPGSIILRLGDEKYTPQDPRVRDLRRVHTAEWLSSGMTDGEQIGISQILPVRTSEDGLDRQSEGQDHELRIELHRYDFFDFLSTHLLLVHGTPGEKELLGEVLGNSGPLLPSTSFPNALSVGLSLFCDGQDSLVLCRRSRTVSLGGQWEGGKVFNAIGENFTDRDFRVDVDGAMVSTVEDAAQRGIFQEMGFSIQDVNMCTVRVHSFAWATDIFDYKFFGIATTPLTFAEVHERWLRAPDKEGEPFRQAVGTHSERRRLLSWIANQPEQWSPEAIFSTVRSLLALRLIDRADLLRAFGGRRQ